MGAFLLLATLAQGQAGAEEDVTLLRAREGAAALLRGQYDKAIAAYDQALQAKEIADFVEANIYSDRGIAKWRLKRTKEAVGDFNKSIELSAENPAVYNNRGNALIDLGHADEAVKDFDRAITLSPTYGPAYNNRGNAHMTLGQYAAAFQDFRKAVELMPTSAVPFNGRGKAHAELVRYHAAVRDFNRALALNAKYEPAYRNRAETYLVLGKYREAADDVTLALASQPEQPELLLMRARAYDGDKKYITALEDLNKAIELKPELAAAYIERGNVFTAVRRVDDGIGDYTRAIELDPKNVDAYALRASAKLQILAKEGEPAPADAALADVNQALLLAPDNALALRVRGNIYEALTRTDDAIADYRLALAKDPFQAESRMALMRLKQEVPPEEGTPLDAPVSDWVVREPSPGRFIASNPKYPALRADLEMFGSGKPKILEWSLMKDALAGIGLLRYYAGDLGQADEGSLEYVAIVDLYANKVVSIEPHSWGSNAAQWNWQAVSVVVTDPEGNANEIKLRKPKAARPVARQDDSWPGRVDRGREPRREGFEGGTREARKGGRRGGGGGGGIFNWLFQ
ncbi:MAG: tetratricopeptide repeat protein [Methyloceanibacter sp.]|uniref:tetratricopeptide repeat protein n=1 Tax=Methyloceanibacter sp. TaxID=1965321 RepID=UPI003D9AC370